MRWTIVVLGLLSLPSLSSARAQFTGDSVGVTVRDSLTPGKPAPSGLIVSATGDTLSAPSRKSKSPALAMLLSAVMPGAGQVYNQSYWKLPIVFGFGAYFTAEWLHYNRLTSEARDNYARSLQTAPGVGDFHQLELRDFYKERRDTFTWYLLILYLVNVADAFVDASLFDFNVSDDLSMEVVPDPSGRLAIRLSF